MNESCPSNRSDAKAARSGNASGTFAAKRDSPPGIPDLAGWPGARELEQTCAAWLESEGLLLDEEAHVDRTLALLISELKERKAHGYGDAAGGCPVTLPPPSDGDIRDAALRAAQSLVKQDYARVRVGDLAAWGHSPRDRFLVEGMGFSPRATALVAVHFNGLQRELRRALLGILIQHRPAEEVLRREGAWDSLPSLYHEMRETLIELRNLGGIRR